VNAASHKSKKPHFRTNLSYLLLQPRVIPFRGTEAFPHKFVLRIMRTWGISSPATPAKMPNTCHTLWGRDGMCLPRVIPILTPDEHANGEVLERTVRAGGPSSDFFGGMLSSWLSAPYYCFIHLINWWRRGQLESKEQKVLDDALLRAVQEEADDAGAPSALARNLIMLGARALACDQTTGQTALHYAARRRDDSTMQYLVRCGGADINHQNNTTKDSPLHLLLEPSNQPFSRMDFFEKQKRCLPTLRWMLAKGATVDSRNRKGLAPLHLACKQVSIGSGDSIHMAFEDEFVGPMRLLLDRGADPHARDGQGRTVLHHLMADCAAFLGERVQLALRTTSHLDLYDARDKLGWSPLHWACYTGNFEGVRWLLHHGASVHARGHRADTVLHVACLKGKPDSIEQLLAHESDPHARMDTGENSFAVACQYGNVDAMRSMAQSATSWSGFVDAQICDGETCLHRECRDGNLYMVEHLLLRCLADPNIKDNAGRRAMDMAFEGPNLDTVPVLIYKEAASEKSLGHNEIYGIYKASTRAFEEYLKRNTPDRFFDVKGVKNFKRASRHLLQTKESSKEPVIPEIVFAHLVAAIKLRAAMAKRLGGGDAGHRHFLELLQKCRDMLSDRVERQPWVLLLEPQSGEIYGHVFKPQSGVEINDDDDDLSDDEEYELSDYYMEGNDFLEELSEMNCDGFFMEL
jgi:ankyrin repeat protein